MREIEAFCGRVRNADKFSPRTLDIDILTYGKQKIALDRIQVPRDEILKYAFVAGPLADVAPAERHPVTGQAYAEIWAEFPEAIRKELKVVEL